MKLRKSGFYKDEEDDLLRFCLSDDYPRSITIERTGTTYTVGHPKAARYLWRSLRGLKRRDDFHGVDAYNNEDHRVMELNWQRLHPERIMQ